VADTASILTPVGRVILIWGAWREIGLAIAQRLLDEGYRLSPGVRHPEHLQHPCLGKQAGATPPAERMDPDTIARTVSFLLTLPDTTPAAKMPLNTRLESTL
jgi:hypothetical protein